MFEAHFDDKRSLVVVPSGGVKKGETSNYEFTEFDSSLCHVPKYNWRDRFFGILSFKRGESSFLPFTLLSFTLCKYN